MRRVVTAATATVLACLSVSACGSDTFSDDTKSQGVTAMCATAKGNLAGLEASAATAKLAASAIRDVFSDDSSIHRIADQVVRNPSDGAVRQRLRDAIRGECDK